jgi:hypothetical protein
VEEFRKGWPETEFFFQARHDAYEVHRRRADAEKVLRGLKRKLAELFRNEGEDASERGGLRSRQLLASLRRRRARSRQRLAIDLPIRRQWQPV